MGISTKTIQENKTRVAYLPHKSAVLNGIILSFLLPADHCASAIFSIKVNAKRGVRKYFIFPIVKKQPIYSSRQINVKND